MIQIKSKVTGNVLFDGKFKSYKLCLEAAVKARADLSGAYLSGADLSGANLSGANLSNADLSDAYLYGAELSGAYLSGAYLSGAYLSGANLSGADLYNTKLSGAKLSGADLYDADLSGADLSGADLSGAKNIIHLQWRGFSFYIQKNCSKIGCKYLKNSEWLNMDIETAVDMGIERKDFYNYRRILKTGIKLLNHEEDLNESNTIATRD